MSWPEEELEEELEDEDVSIELVDVELDEVEELEEELLELDVELLLLEELLLEEELLEEVLLDELLLEEEWLAEEELVDEFTDEDVLALLEEELDVVELLGFVDIDIELLSLLSAEETLLLSEAGCDLLVWPPPNENSHAVIDKAINTKVLNRKCLFFILFASIYWYFTLFAFYWQ